MKKILLLLLLCIPLFTLAQRQKRLGAVIVDSIKALNGSVIDIKDLASFEAALKVDSIAEFTSANGVKIDDVLLKDGGVQMSASEIKFDRSQGAGFFTRLQSVGAPSAARTITLPDLSGELALDANKLSFFSVTTSSELAGVVTNETGTVLLVYNTAPTLVSPVITTSPTATGATWTSLGSVTTVDINGGTVDGVIIGSVSARKGTFTNLTSTGVVVFSGTEDIAAGGTETVLDRTVSQHMVGADAGGDNFTLANGTVGEIHTIAIDDATGAVTIRPATFNGGTTIRLDALGDSITLQWFATIGWTIIGGNGYTIG